ncbi:hypothetical protein D9M69_503070 [compost metagenome]
MNIPDRLIDDVLFTLRRGEKAFRHFANACQRKIAANRHRLHKTITLTVFRHQNQTLINALSNREACNIPAFEQNAARIGLEATCNRFKKFGTTCTHQTVNTNDLTGTHIQRHIIDKRKITGLVLNRQTFHGKRDIAPFITGWRRTKIEVFADHVANDPFQINLSTRCISGHCTIAQNHGMIGDLQGFFEMVGNVNNRHAARCQITDDLEQHFHFRSA